MTFAIVLVIAAFLSLVVIVRIAVLPNVQISTKDSAGTPIQPIDVEAFRNLCDPGEEEYLRRRLTESEYRQVRRVRLRALAAYVRAAGQNAGVLVYQGQSAMASPDQATAAAASELVGEALLLRRNATFALVKIYVALAWTPASFAAAPFVKHYEQLNGSAMLLGRLQNPASPVRILAS